MRFFTHRGRSGGGQRTKRIKFSAGKCTLLIAPVGANKRALMHWKPKYRFSFGKMHVFGNRGGSGGGLGTQNIGFPFEKCTKVVGNKLGLD